MWETTSKKMRDINIQQWTADSPFLHESHQAVLWTETDKDNDKLVANFKLGDSAVSLSAKWLMSPVGSGYENHVNFEVWVPNVFKGKTLGLLGNYDGNITNEYKNRAGGTLDGFKNPHTNSVKITNHTMDCELHINACMHVCMY